MKTIDIKSLLIGVLATALLFACADADKTSPSIVSEAKAATSQPDPRLGKYQIAYHGKEGQMYLVNTTTGKLYKSSGELGWDSLGQPDMFFR